MKLKTFSTIAAVLLIAAGCDSSGDIPGTALATSPPQIDPATIQVLHASPDAPPVDILVNGDVAIPDLDYKQSSGQIELEPGTYTIEVSAQLPGDDQVVIGPVDLDFGSLVTYTIAAVNDAAEIEPVVLSQSQAPLATGNAELFVLHGADGVGPVDVYVTTPDADLTATAPVGTFDFKGTIGPAEVPAGTYQIRVTPAGDPSTVAFDSGAVDLASGSRFVVTAVPSTVGDASPISLTLQNATGAIELIDTREQARVRAVHNAADVPAVDVVADGGVVFAGATFPNVTDITEVPGGTYTIEVATAGDYPAGVAIGPVDLPFAAGTTSTVVARGTLMNDDLGASQLIEDTRPVALYSKVRIFHGASTAPPVDIYLVEPGSTDLTTGLGLVVSGLAYPNSTGFAAIPAGTYDAIVTLAGTDTVAIGPAALPALMNGGVYNVIARDPEMGSMDFGLTVYGE